MKKKLLLIAFSLLFVASGITFYFTNQNINTYADSVSTASQTYDVNFIAPDNSILFAVDNISEGVSLNDINNSSMLVNSSFLNNSLGLNEYLCDGWANSDPCIDNWLYRGRVGTSIFVNSDKSITVNDCWFYQFLPIDNFVLGETYTFSFNVLNSSGNLNVSFVGDDDQYTSNLLIGRTLGPDFTGIYNLSYTVPLDYSYDYIGIRFYGSNFTINYAYLRQSSYQNTYFYFDYLNYLLSEYNFSNNIYSYDINYNLPITSNKYYYPKLNYVSNSTWYSKTWSGLTSFDGNYIWFDGTNYYYSSGNSQYVLDITTSTWTQKTWSGLTSFNGFNVWTDGINYYYSSGNSQYILDITTSTWTQKTWSDLTSFNGSKVWTDGTNYYYSVGNSQYVLDTTTSTWTSKTWSGLTSFDGANVWTDGTNYYYSAYLAAGGIYKAQYILDMTTSTWTQKTWSGFSNLNGANIWTDGTNYYYSSGNSQYVLDITTSTWIPKTWSGLTSFNGSSVWLTNFGIFYSISFNQFVLGESLFDINPDYYYDQGYADGYSSGEDFGFNEGYYVGLDDAGNYTFFSLFGAVLDAPVKTLTGLFNFDLLGVNLWRFFTALFTLAIIILIVKLCLGGK